MADYDNAMPNASSLDIANTSSLMRRDKKTGSDVMNTPDTTEKPVKQAIIVKLREAFAPESLEVTDESHLHEGHAGHKPGGETHFRVYIVSSAFKGKSRIECHRLINAILTAELAGPIHALAIKAEAPAG